MSTPTADEKRDLALTILTAKIRNNRERVIIRRHQIEHGVSMQHGEKQLTSIEQLNNIEKIEKRISVYKAIRDDIRQIYGNAQKEELSPAQIERFL